MALPPPKTPAGAVTRAELLSDVAVQAMQLADYKLRHKARYFGWSEDKRDAYRLAAAFDAVIRARAATELPKQLVAERVD